MKNHTIQPRSSLRRVLWLACGSLVIALIAAGTAFWSSSAAARANDPEPIIAILIPHDGARLNAASLRVQVLVAAVKSRNGESFVFNGQTVAGRNAGRVRRVDLALDGILLRSIDTSEYGRQFVTDFVVDLSAINEGLHLLTINAVQGNGNNEATKSVSTTFTLDRSLVLAEDNRIEQVATPKPFAGLRVRGWDGQDDDDADEEDPWQCPPRFDLKGTIMLGAESDGIDLARDRVVVALGSQTKVFEPGTLRCNGHEKTCRFEDASQPFVRFIELKRKNNGRWKYRLRGTGPLPGAGGSTLSLRVGNDWGSIDLATGERIASLRPNLDASHQAQASIGAGGGTVETINARGVVIRLQIPPGALTRDTLITMTPLLTSPLAGDTGAQHPGVKFEPEGLIFAQPAILTLDLSATGHAVTNNDFLFLFTSPLTALPLYGQADPQTSTITAELPHFSSAGAVNGPVPYVDFAAWTNAYLASTTQPSLAMLRTLTSLARLQAQIGCAGANCMDEAQLAARIRADIEALVRLSCPLDIGDPSDGALARYLGLETLAQQANVEVPLLRQCVAGLLEALIDRTWQEGIAAPANGAYLDRLVELTSHARLLGYASAQELGRRHMEDLLRRMIDHEAAAAAAVPTDAAFDKLIQLQQLAQQLGFPSLETHALQGLATALRVLLANGQRICNGPGGTEGLALLLRAQGYAPIVTQVDVALASDIQAAIEDCQGGAMRVRLNPADTDTTVENPTYLKFLHRGFDCDQIIANPASTNYYGCETVPLSQRFGGLSSAPPLSLEEQLRSMQARVSVRQPSLNVLAVNLNAIADSTGGNDYNEIYVSILADFVFTKAGVLDLAINTEWTEDSEFQSGLTALVFDVGQTSATEGLLVHNHFAPGPTGRLVISGPRTIRLNLVLVVYQAGGGYIAGSGRIITATFTPSPQP